MSTFLRSDWGRRLVRWSRRPSNAGIIIDFNREGRMFGIEVLDASEVLRTDVLTRETIPRVSQ